MGKSNNSRSRESWPKTGTRKPGARPYQNCEKAAPALTTDAPWRGETPGINGTHGNTNHDGIASLGEACTEKKA